MCLTTNDPRIKTADENMLVYKIIGGDNSSYHNRLKYIRGKVNPKVKLNTFRFLDSRPFIVNEGYHSSPDSFRTGDGEANSIFIIPKGASYIEGTYNDSSSILNIVSSTIIFIGKTETRWQRFLTNRRLKKYIK